LIQIYHIQKEMFFMKKLSSKTWIRGFLGFLGFLGLENPTMFLFFAFFGAFQYYW